MSGADINTRWKNKWFIACIILLVLVIGASTAFFVFRQRETAAPDTSRERSEQIIKKVGRLYILPENETPTVALIEDKDSIGKDQQFYQNAKNGDYVLVYNKAKIALLYRDSNNKLVNVSPVLPTAQVQPRDE